MMAIKSMMAMKFLEDKYQSKSKKRRRKRKNQKPQTFQYKHTSNNKPSTHQANKATATRKPHTTSHMKWTLTVTCVTSWTRIPTYN